MLSLDCRLLRGLLRYQYSFQILPASNVKNREAKADAWIACDSDPRLSLEPTCGRWPQGWVLFRSRLVRRTSDYRARLYLDLGQGFSDENALAIPVTQKGTIHELIFLPKGLVGLQWSPIGAAGSFEQTPIIMTEIGGAERIYRMVSRILSMHKRVSKKERANCGLNHYRLLTDLQSEYRKAGILRSYNPPRHTGPWTEFYREDGVRMVRIQRDAIIATFAHAAANLFKPNSANIKASSIELSLVRQYLFPHLIGLVRQEYSQGQKIISVPIQEP